LRAGGLRADSASTRGWDAFTGHDTGTAVGSRRRASPGVPKESPLYPVEDLRAAMDLPDVVPVVLCDARERPSCRDVLLDLSTYLLELVPDE